MVLKRFVGEKIVVADQFLNDEAAKEAAPTEGHKVFDKMIDPKSEFKTFASGEEERVNHIGLNGEEDVVDGESRLGNGEAIADKKYILEVVEIKGHQMFDEMPESRSETFIEEEAKISEMESIDLKGFKEDDSGTGHVMSMRKGNLGMAKCDRKPKTQSKLQCSILGAVRECPFDSGILKIQHVFRGVQFVDHYYNLKAFTNGGDEHGYCLPEKTDQDREIDSLFADLEMEVVVCKFGNFSSKGGRTTTGEASAALSYLGGLNSFHGIYNGYWNEEFSKSCVDYIYQHVMNISVRNTFLRRDEMKCRTVKQEEFALLRGSVKKSWGKERKPSNNWEDTGQWPCDKGTQEDDDVVDGRFVLDCGELPYDNNHYTISFSRKPNMRSERVQELSLTADRNFHEFRGCFEVLEEVNRSDEIIAAWLPIVYGDFISFSVSDFWVQSCRRQCEVLSLVFSFCLPHFFAATPLLSRIFRRVLDFFGPSKGDDNLSLAGDSSPLWEERALEVVGDLSKNYWTGYFVVTMRKFQEICMGSDEALAILSYGSPRGRAAPLIVNLADPIETLEVCQSPGAVCAASSAYYSILHLIWTAEKLEQQLDLIDQPYQKSRNSAVAHALAILGDIEILQRAMKVRLASNRDLHILTFDGVGIKGLATVKILREIEKGTREDERLKLLKLYLNKHMAEARARKSVYAVLSSILLVRVQSACLELGEHIHIYIEEKGIELSVILGTALVNMHTDDGSLVKAKQYFDRLKDKIFATWSTMICELTVQGHAKEALSLSRKQEKEKLMPNGIILLGGVTWEPAISTSGVLLLFLMTLVSVIILEERHKSTIVVVSSFIYLSRLWPPPEPPPWQYGSLVVETWINYKLGLTNWSLEDKAIIRGKVCNDANLKRIVGRRRFDKRRDSLNKTLVYVLAFLHMNQSQVLGLGFEFAIKRRIGQR